MSWQHALDVQMDTHKWMGNHYGTLYTQGFFEDLLKYREKEFPHEAVILHNNIVQTLWRADTMFVTKDMQHLLLQAAHDLPDDAAFDLHTLITPIGFCLFEEPMYGKDTQGSTLGVSGIAWHTAAVENMEGVTVCAIYFFTDTADQFDEINSNVIPKLRAANIPVPPLALMHFYPLLGGDAPPQGDTPGSELVAATIRLFMAMQLLAQQRIGEPIKLPAPRAARKRYIREGGDPHQTRMITLITLRRKSVKHDDEHQKIEWSHRWVVRGHWRRQWYAKTKRHDWVYIYEHIKGPENAPLLLKERRVFNFRR